jgi:tetratricopeptide (TPR) repeat protein
VTRLAVILVLFCFANPSASQSTEFYNLYFEGNALLAKGQFDKAIARYNEALKEGSADYVYFNRGNAFFGNKDYHNALADYNKTLSMNDEYSVAYYQRALVKLNLGDQKGCCDDFKKAHKLEVDGADAAYKKYCK